MWYWRDWEEAEELALFMKSFSGGRTGSGSSGKKKGKSKPKLRPTDVGRTECTVAWCSVDNWQLLTNSKFCGGELRRMSNDRRQDNGIKSTYVKILHWLPN